MDDFSLSPLSLFVQAGPVGKAVMALLLVASIWCWLLIVEGLFGLARLVPRDRAGGFSPLLAAVDEAARVRRACAWAAKPCRSAASACPRR